MHTTLIVPGLFPEIPDAAIPRLPHLERWLCRGDLTLVAGQWLLEPSLAQAAAQTLAGSTAGAAGLTDFPHWLCADPIHLQVESDSLILVERSGFTLEPAEAEALIAVLNAHFAAEGLRFFAPQPDRWLVGMAAPPGLTTTVHPLARAGRNIDGYLPQGPEGRRWRVRFNEAQMLLHEHPVNLARAQRKARVVSGVWFWDSDAQAAPLPAPLRAALTPADPAPSRIIESLRGPSAYGDADGWAEAALALDATVIAALLDDLAAGRTSQLTLIALEGRCAAVATLTRTQRLRVWRRPLPLHRLPGVPALDHR